MKPLLRLCLYELASDGTISARVWFVLSIFRITADLRLAPYVSFTAMRFTLRSKGGDIFAASRRFASRNFAHPFPDPAAQSVIRQAATVPLARSPRRTLALLRRGRMGRTIRGYRLAAFLLRPCPRALRNLRAARHAALFVSLLSRMGQILLESIKIRAFIPLLSAELRFRLRSRRFYIFCRPRQFCILPRCSCSAFF
jgi:hypothetical protein